MGQNPVFIPMLREMARLKAYIAVLLRSVQYHVQVAGLGKPFIVYLFSPCLS